MTRARTRSPRALRERRRAARRAPCRRRRAATARARRRRRRRARAPPAREATTRCSSRRSTRATCSTTAPAASCGPTTRTSRCSPATASTRSGSPGWPSSATSRRSRELADVISLAAQAHAEGDAERAAAVWAAGVARGRRTAAPAEPRGRQGRVAPASRRRARSRRRTGALAHARARCDLASPGVDTVRLPWPTDAKSPRASTPPTAGCPGAFEGETVTRRRLMTLTAHGARRRRRRGVHAARRSASPPARRCSSGRRSTLEPVGAAGRLPDRHLRPARDHRPCRASAQVGKTTVYVRARNPEIDAAEPARRRRARSSRSRRAACTSAARCATSTPPSASSARATAASTTSRGQVDGGPPVRPLDRFYTRVRNGQVEVGPRYSVNCEFQPLPVLPRPGAGPRRHRPVPVPRPLLHAPEARQPAMKLPLPPLPPRSSRSPSAPARTEQRQAARPGQGGRDLRRRLGRRAHLAVRRAALGDVPQGARRGRTGSTRWARRRCSPSSRRP